MEPGSNTLIYKIFSTAPARTAQQDVASLVVMLIISDVEINGRQGRACPAHRAALQDNGPEAPAAGCGRVHPLPQPERVWKRGGVLNNQ